MKYDLFTMPMCYDCQRIKEAIGADPEETRQNIQIEAGEVEVYLLPKDGQPDSKDEAYALAQMDYYFDGQVQTPALVVDSNGALKYRIMNDPERIADELGIELD